MPHDVESLSLRSWSGWFPLLDRDKADDGQGPSRCDSQERSAGGRQQALEENGMRLRGKIVCADDVVANLDRVFGSRCGRCKRDWKRFLSVVLRCVRVSVSGPPFLVAGRGTLKEVYFLSEGTSSSSPLVVDGTLCGHHKRGWKMLCLEIREFKSDQ